MTLGADFHGDLRVVLTTLALTAVAPLSFTKARGQVLEEGLADATNKLVNILERSTIRDARHRAALQLALGDALLTLGKREPGTDRLWRAVEAFRAALAGYPRRQSPLDWATVQNNLGNALLAIGKREGGTERIKQAVSAYRAALEETSRGNAPPRLGCDAK